MNDLSVIIAHNENATKEAQINAIKATGKVALVQKLSGLLNIGDVKEYDTVQDARQAAHGLFGQWYIA